MEFLSFIKEYWILGLGILFVIAGLNVAISNKKFMSTAAETTGVITRIDVNHSPWNGEGGGIVYVTYNVMTVDGEQEITAALAEYSSLVYVGQRLKLVYDPNNVTNVRTEFFNVGILGWVLAAIGFVAVIAVLCIKLWY